MTDETQGGESLGKELDAKVARAEMQARYFEAQIRVIEARRKLAELRRALKQGG
jgi:hypothetical protein